MAELYSAGKMTAPRSVSALMLALLAARIVAPLAVPRLPEFKDSSAALGIPFQTVSSATSQKYLPESMLGGVAVLDYDGDGWMDLYFVNGAALADPMPSGKQPDKSDPR